MTLQTFPVFYKKTTNLLCFFGWFICLSLISVANRHKCLLHFGKKGWRLFCIICTYDDLQRVTWLINRLYTRSPETTSDNSLKEEKRVWRIKSDVLEKSYTMCFQFWWDFSFFTEASRCFASLLSSLVFQKMIHWNTQEIRSNRSQRRRKKKNNNCKMK